MRRQARISAGGALVVRTASALQVWLWLLIFVFQNEFRISRSIQPGYLDFDNLPETNFTCAGKVIGGYYADLETSCQMFHVCTVGQQDEPMDIKFLCLNGTVFDQETRVCERVDEVDCTKSEKFYSLNLELYGSTAPPIIQPEQIKPQTQPTQQSHQQTKTSDEETDPNINDSSTSSVDKTNSHVTEIIDSTDDPVDTKKQDPHHQESVPTHSTATGIEDIIDDNQEGEDVDENADYEEDYTHLPTTTTTQAPVPTTKSSTKPPPTTTTVPHDSSPHQPSQIPHFISTPSPTLSSLSPPIHSSSISSSPSAPTLDPSLLSPQEFIYRHRGPGSEAISFQRQSLRPADGVFITHAPPQQFDHFQYESSRTQPRPSAPRPAPFVQRPQPFRPTTLDPRNQLLRPAPTLLPAEKQENPQNNKHPFPPSLASRPLPFDPYYYDRKRSDDSARENESSLAARSVAPPTVTERPPTKLKSPPRVIVTASASVSDSNGKRLNYTVGNVVSAVKPIVPINYDDYKESDLIFDPFFLDVPKLQKRRKTRSSRNRRVFTVPATATVSLDIVKEKTTVSSPVTSRATTTERSSTAAPTTTTTAAWNPNDYVDDNYEPHAYVPPVPPLAVLVPHKFSKEERHHKSRVAQTTSSQSVGSDTSPVATSQPSPRPLEAPACATSRSTDCRTRA